ncbi:MAG: hypothetical protein EBR01_13455 [Proteobacteria bacterium]|jgi:aromatic ring-opening dioxygenase catalytic subunit (LigB family)|nr:hypothetical protein [Pseudomonadota bacterium]
MEKLTRFLPLGLFCVFSLKLIALGAQLTDSLVLLVLASYSAYHEFKTVDKQIKEFEDRLKENERVITQKAKEIEDVKALLSSVKLGQQLKTIQSNRG